MSDYNVKRDALKRAIARRLYSAIEDQFIALEEGVIYSHCLSASEIFVEGILTETVLKATGAFDGDFGILYRTNLK